MSDATPIDEALDGLSELAACDLRLAKRFCARIEALPEEDADDRANDLARSYQRMARSYRQSVVVQMRLRRELAAEAKADAVDERNALSEALALGPPSDGSATAAPPCPAGPDGRLAPPMDLPPWADEDSS